MEVALQAGRFLVAFLVQADPAGLALGGNWLGGQVLGVLEALVACRLFLVVLPACLMGLLDAVQASHLELVA